MQLKSFDQFEQAISEGLFDWLLGKKSEVEKPQQPIPASQAPAVIDELPVNEADLFEFYAVLQEFVDSNQAIAVQSFGHMQYSKVVEYIQTALSFLGYPLARHGIDGYFGPETAKAIVNFNADSSEKRSDDL